MIDGAGGRDGGMSAIFADAFGGGYVGAIDGRGASTAAGTD